MNVEEGSPVPTTLGYLVPIKRLFPWAYVWWNTVLEV